MDSGQQASSLHPGQPVPGTPPRRPGAPASEQGTLGERTLIGTEYSRDVAAEAVAKQVPKEAEFRATLKVVTGGTVSNYSLKKEKTVTTIGSSREDADIVVNDNAVAAKQLAVIYNDNTYVLADCGVNDICTFDGVLARQIICPIGTRCVVNMHNTTVIFDSESGTAPRPGDTRPKKYFHMDSTTGAAPARTNGAFSLKMESRTSRSTGEPIMIGAHQDCDITIRGEGVKPFHAIVHWGPDGIYISNLSTGASWVNGEQIEGFMMLQNEDIISIGGIELQYNASGDIEGRCVAMFGDYRLDFNYLRLTALPGSVARSFMLPAIGGAIIVGRSPNADVTLEDGAVSREHAQLIPSGKSCQLIDNYSANGCYVNGEKVTKARLRAGDMVEIGRSIFFLHFD